MPISPEDGAMLVGFFEAADGARVEAESKWGVGRLELIIGRIDAVLLARFRGQQARWRAALESAWKADFITRDALALVEQKAGAMRRGWAALDALAEEAGMRPVAPWVWEVRLADGSVVAFVQTDAEASKVLAEGRQVAVYTAQEIANLIDMIPAALQQAKEVFPGAKLQPPDPFRRSSEAIPWDDPIPFGEPQEDAA
jgi:hypothetical protein